MSAYTPLCQHDTGTAPLVYCWTCRIRRPDEPWNTTAGNPSYAIRPCRGSHWHVTCCGEDIMVESADLNPWDSFSTAEKAQAAADLLNSRPTAVGGSR